MAELSQKQLNEGLKFIVGKWQIDYLVNTWSANLDHLPASQFKSNEGKDLSQISWEFFEDHTMKMRNDATGDEETCTWTQTSDSKFRYDGKWFGLIQNETVLSNIQNLEKDMDGGLVFSMMFVIRLKKTAEGEVHIVEEPKEKDIGEIEPTADDLKKKDIVGRWAVYKSFASVGGQLGQFTRAEAEGDLEKRKAAGEFADDERRYEHAREGLSAFGTVFEFTDDYKVKTYSPIPPGVSQAEIDEAVASGDVKLVDGMIYAGEDKKWKYVKGEYWYDSEEHREICGEVKSSWDKITPDSEGHMQFTMFVLEKKK